MEALEQQYALPDGAATRVGGEVLARVFLWTGLGLGLSLMTAALLGWSGGVVALTSSSDADIVLLLLPALPFGALVLALRRLPLDAVRALYVLFAITSGAALSVVLSMAPPSTLAVALGPASIGFVGAGLGGLIAGREPRRARLVGAMTGIGLVAAAVIGLAGESLLLPCLGVLAGALLASFDLLWSRRIDELGGDVADADRLAVGGALCLLLDLLALSLWLAYLLASALALTVSDA